MIISTNVHKRDETKTAGEQNSTNREEQQVRDEKDQAPCISAKPYGSDESDREKSTAEELLGKPPERPGAYLGGNN